MNKANNYDSYAAERQRKLREGLEPSHVYVEKPAMERLLVDLSGKKVLLLGCGTGEESELIGRMNAEKVVGIDSSRESVRLARKSYPQHDFVVGDMHNLEFKDESFDFVYSSLAVHYSDDPLVLYTQVNRILKPGGVFQFSTVHPVRWNLADVKLNGKDVRIMGFSQGYAEEADIYGSYMEFTKRKHTMVHGKEVLEFWVGPPSMHFGMLIEAGFRINKFDETKATEEAQVSMPYYYQRFTKFPQFMLFVAEKI